MKKLPTNIKAGTYALNPDMSVLDALALFVEAVDDANRAKYETVYVDEETGVVVRPVFVETGT